MPGEGGWVYPRTGGGTVEPRDASRNVYPRTGGGQLTMGLSPHGRGNRIASVPARAGEPGHRVYAPAPRVYPRTGGGTDTLPGRLSPQTIEVGPTLRRVYPRTGGGTRARDNAGVYPRTGDLPGTHRGLSPHGRGNRRRSAPRRTPGSGAGSIPARAGEPPVTTPYSPWGLSPHGRGNLDGPVQRTTRARGHWGLSPHGRGNSRSCSQSGGLSPHGRGNPPVAAGRRPRHAGVYPRTGGGTSTKQQTDNAQLLRNKCRVCVLTGS